MIGYTADAGYVRNATSEGGLLVIEDSDLVVLDRDKIFTVSTTTQTGDIPEGTSSSGGMQVKTRQEAIGILQSVLLEDFYTVYAVRGNSRRDDQKKRYAFETMFSTIYDMTPVTNELTDITLRVFWHLKSPDVLFTLAGNSSSPAMVVLRKTGTKWIQSSSISYNFSSFPRVGFTQESNLGILNCTNVSDMANPDSWRALFVGTFYTGGETVSLQWFPGISLSNFVQDVFGNSPPPDIYIPEGDPDNPDGNNPFNPGGTSGPGTEPPGTFDDTSDPIPDSPLPTISSSDTGFTRIYNPTLSQVQSLARYLWTDPDVLQTIWNHIKQIFEDPMSAMIAFNLVPCRVPDGGTREFALMYIGTGVQMTAAASQFVDVDCGTLELERYYGSALDQSPYTKVGAFLPYIGHVTLDTDEVMGTTLQIKYRIDIVSGSCVAKIFVDGSVLYQYSGHCAVNIPFSSADFSTYASAIMSIAKLGIAAATGSGALAIPTGTREGEQQTNRVTTTTRTDTVAEANPSGGDQTVRRTKVSTVVKEEQVDTSSTGASFSGITAANVANTVSQVMGSKPHTEHSGAFTGNSGYLGVRRPYLIIERPNMCMPSTYQSMNGFPCMMSLNLGALSGYTEVYQVQLNGMTATNPEQAEILTLLKGGVIL